MTTSGQLQGVWVLSSAILLMILAESGAAQKMKRKKPTAVCNEVRVSLLTSVEIWDIINMEIYDAMCRKLELSTIKMRYWTDLQQD